MKVKVLLLLISFCLLATFSLPAWSDEGKKAEEDFTAYDLGEVVVSGDKPAAVTKTTVVNEITAEQIQATNSRTVAEALAHAPGVRVSTGRKNEPGVAVRGFDQTRVLVLIDGVPYYESKYRKLDLNQIPTDAVAKIVVTKGAPSVLYGANAMGGVINIVTKKATSKPIVSATFEMGENGNNREVLSTGWKKDIFSGWFSYIRNESPSWRLSDDYKERIGTVTWKGKKPYTGHSSLVEPALLENGGQRDNSYMNSDSIFAKFGVEPNPDSEYFVNFFYITREKGLPPNIDSEMVQGPSNPKFSNMAKIPRYDDWDIDLSGKQKICDQLTMEGKLFYHNHIDDYASYFDKQIDSTGIWIPDYDKRQSNSRYIDFVYGGSLIATYQPVEWDILRFSYHLQRDDHKQRDDDDLPFAESWSNTRSMGLENEFNLIKDLQVVAGVSWDAFKVRRAESANYVTDKNGNITSTYMTTTKPGPTKYDWNPMGGLTYQLDQDTRLFTSVARKSRYPTLNELYSSKGGNPDLKAENSVNTTVGVDHSFGKFAWAQVAYFYHDVQNWITRSGPDKTDPNMNIGEVTMQGFELNTEFYLPIKDLVLTFDYMFDHVLDQSEGRVTNRVPYIPLHTFDAGLRYIVPKIGTRLDFNATYISKTYTKVPTFSAPTDVPTTGDPQMTFDCRISQKFLQYFEAYMAMKNLADRYYCPEDGYPAEGRTVWFGLTAKY